MNFFQPLDYEYLFVFSAFYDNMLSIFGFWCDSPTKQDT